MPDIPPPFKQDLEWTDETLYEWKIWSTKSDFAGMLAYFIGAAVGFPALMYLLLWAVSLFSENVAYIIGLVITGVFLLMLITQLVTTWKGKKHQQIQARGDILFGAIATLGGLFYVLSSPVSHFRDGFHAGESANLGQWVLFYLDNTASVILLDIPELFDLRTSPITVNDPVSRLLTVLIRLLITIGFIRLILELYRSRYSSTTIHCTIRDLYWHCALIPDQDDMAFQKKGEVIVVFETPELDVNEFLTHFKEVAEKELSEKEKKS